MRNCSRPEYHSGLGNQNLHANGQRTTSNTMQVNGVDVTNLFTA